ncbi:MAG: tRNA (adenosine(37)-N6)-threonylcarbamoyltransferase complex ATPase subunit type 1 TsaE, partial [Rickettsiales bacterium]|nr:tRNA (adenosine(37)-N6)-threonylcarbamoyltransferase complex ATPase subunit type 1 TsaE [Rickettsiales bacterium]
MMPNITRILHTLDDTQNIAETVAKSIHHDDIITLQGDLGAGKTSFTKYFISHLTGNERDEIISPTFNLLQTYDYPQGTIFHYDLYRLENEDELYELGFEESLGNGICIIEWP